MNEEYLTRRKLINLLKYIKHRQWNVTIIDDIHCSFEGAQRCMKYTGVIESFEVVQYQDAEIKLNVKIGKHDATIWLSNDYYLTKFDMKNEIIWTVNNGDGTFSDFIIKFT